MTCGRIVFDVEDNLFMLPGPVKMHPRVLQAMARPAMAHRSPEFSAVNERILRGMKQLMDAPRVAMLSGSGTAGMEAAISNLVHWGDNAIALENGKFGQRMGELVSRYAGESARILSSPWGGGVNLEELETNLQEGASVVAFTLNETSTAVSNQGPDIVALCNKYGALSIADTITATGSVPAPLQEWGLDVSITGSQKCVGGPSGLAFVGLSPRALAACDSPSLYFDLPRYVARHEKDHQTPFTAAVPLHLAMDVALEMVFAEGLEARFARTRQLAEFCRSAATAAGLELAATSHHSDTVTAICYPAGVDDKLRATLKDAGVVVAGAQGQWKGRVFRIGHMAGCTMQELRATWVAIAAAMQQHGHTVDATLYQLLAGTK